MKSCFLHPLYYLLVWFGAFSQTVVFASKESRQTDILSFVHPMMGTSGPGNVIPIAAHPFGMVQLGPDTYFNAAGYHYSHNRIFGFSHTHKSGGGGTDFQDILFLPVAGENWNTCTTFPKELSYPFSHQDEEAKAGYYRVRLQGSNIQTELTATSRCGFHRYTYPANSTEWVVVNLKSGSQHACTIIEEDNFDTVKTSRLEWIDNQTVQGYRISNGWCPEQHVYFYAHFSKPIETCRIYEQCLLQQEKKSAEGTDIRALLRFKSDGEPLTVSVGISPVSMEGARANLKAEIGKKTFDDVLKLTQNEWRKQLSAIQIEGDAELQNTFYTCLYYALLYPQLYSDVTGNYRSSDKKVYHGNYRYFAGVLGLWDTFRAQIPLITLLQPSVTQDMMRTFLEHFRHCGQLPIWTLAGQENMCMIGYHAMPTIADAYSKGIRGYDAASLFNAMKISANRDTFGYFLRAYRGAKLYKQYHYVPCDLEITATSKTLEYCYDDWCIAQMARMLNKKDDEAYYLERAGWYRNVFDSSTSFMRGRLSNGNWRTPFDPFMSNHYRSDDDFCEGNAWQWSFFVPHDGEGLIRLFGGKQAFTTKLDSIFGMSSEIHGDHPAPDISGLIGQYAHGNEPSHHTLFMYNYAAQPWKAQALISQVVHSLYNTSPEGMCGNDDTGQMSAWYVFNSMGFYPVTHGNGLYFIGAPQLRKIVLKHRHGTLTVLAPHASEENCYVQSVTLNDKPYTRNWVSHADLFGKNVTLYFEMGSQPNKNWGSRDEDLPPSMTARK